jgi:microcystin-dependent protein
MAADLVIPNAIVNGEPNDGAQVASNFNAIATWVNANAVHLDASKAFTATPSGPSADPTTANQFARKAYVDATRFPGEMIAYAGPTAPGGWLLCQGQAVSRATFATLFAVIGVAFGVGDGSTTFNLPDLRGRVAVGHDAGQTEFNVLGETGGFKTHTLTLAQLPPHTHTINHDHGSVSSGGQSSGHTHNFSGTSTGQSASHTHGQKVTAFVAGGTGIRLDYDNDAVGAQEYDQGIQTYPASNDHTHDYSGVTGITNTDHSHSVDLPNFTGTSGSAGSDTAHNILQPYQVINWIIKT